MLRALVVASVLFTAGIAQACQLPGAPAKTISDGKTGVAVAYRFTPAQPKIGEFFVVEFAVCDRAGSVSADSLRVDAQMPVHRHGMNFQPKIAAAGGNTFRAEGMMFHMPGKWQLVFEHRAASGTARLLSDLEIE